MEITPRMFRARHIVGDRPVLDWLEVCRLTEPLTFGSRGRGVSTARLVETWRCSPSTVSRRLAAINAAPAAAGLGRIEQAIGRHGWWRVLLADGRPVIR